MDAPTRLGPMAIGDIMDNTFYLYRDHFLTFFGVAVIILLPSTLAVEWLYGLVSPDWRTSLEEAPFVMNFLARSLLGLAIVLVLNVLIAPLQGALVKATSDAALGVRPSIATSFRAAQMRYIPTLAVIVLMSAATLAGSVFLVIPGVLILLWFSVAFQVALLEKVGPVAALARSRKLTRGALGRIFLLFTAFGLLVAAIQYAVYAPVLALIAAALPDGGPLAALLNVFQGLIAALLTPPFLIASTLLYLDLRSRKEGFDIELAADRLEKVTEDQANAG